METVDRDWLEKRLTGKRGELARIAEALRIKPDQVSKIISGDRRIQPEEIPKLLKFFGEDMLVLTPEEQRLLDLYRNAAAARREAAEALLAAPSPKTATDQSPEFS